jgi:hypothetical protein
MNFDMSITDNYASFIDKDTGVAVFVDSFDNQEFVVRIGTINDSDLVGRVFAETNDELNSKLDTLFLAHELPPK